MAKKLTADKAKEILHDKSVHGHPLTDKQRKFFGAIAGGAPVKASSGWLSQYEDGGIESRMGGLTDQGFDYNSAWGGQFQNGGGKKKNKGVEERINNWLGSPMERAEDKADQLAEKWYNPKTKQWESEDQTDNFRHPLAGRYTAEAISNKFPGWMRSTGIPNVAGFIGANILGIGHEIKSPNRNPNYSMWDTIRESGEDAFNNFVGAGVGSLPFISSDTKTNMLKYLSDNNWLPDGIGYVDPKKNNGKGNVYIDKKAMGGSLPGATGFMYARTQSPAPSEGKYAKKTTPSAENGMSFYQHGLDWKPKSISKDGSVIKDNNGYWNPDNWGKVVEIDSPDITMKGVNQPLLGISDEGDIQYMEPGQDYKFKGKKVKEYPVTKSVSQKSTGGWLSQYK